MFVNHILTKYASILKACPPIDISTCDDCGVGNVRRRWNGTTCECKILKQILESLLKVILNYSVMKDQKSK